MTLAELPLLLRVLLAAMGAALLIITVCRMRAMSATRTLARVRHAAAAQGFVGGLLVLAATVRPDWLDLALLACPAAMLAWLAATSHAWARGEQPATMERR